MSVLIAFQSWIIIYEFFSLLSIFLKLWSYRKNLGVNRNFRSINKQWKKGNNYSSSSANIATVMTYTAGISYTLISSPIVSHFDGLLLSEGSIPFLLMPGQLYLPYRSDQSERVLSESKLIVWYQLSLSWVA